MSNERPSLLDTLCKLYVFHIRLQKEFDAEVDKEVKRLALDKAITDGDPIKFIEGYRPFPGWLQRTYGSRWEAAIRDAKINWLKWKRSRVTPVMRGLKWHRWPVNPLMDIEYDERVQLAQSALIEPMRDRVRKRHGKAGKPFEESNAWNFAVEWLAQHMNDFADLGGRLAKYCAYHLFWSAPPQERPSWLAKARGGIRGSVIQALTDGDANRGRGREHTILIPEARRFRDWLLKQPNHQRLASGLCELDEHGKGDELRREICERFRKEAEDAGLPPAVPSPSGGQGGEAAPLVLKKVAGWRRVWRWICSSTAAAYRMTIEAGCSAILEKLSGR